MKKNLIFSIVGTLMVASLVGCGSADKETAADVTTPNEAVVAEVTAEPTDETADEATESTEETPTTPKVVVELGDGTIIEDGTIRYRESEVEETSAESTDFTSTGLAYNTAFKNKDTDYSITYTVLEDGTVAYHTESKSELGISEWDDTYTLEKVLDYGNDFYGIVVKGTFNEFEYYTFLYKKSNPDNVVWVLSTADTVELANYLYDNTTKDTKATDCLDYNGTSVSTEMYTVEK